MWLSEKLRGLLELNVEEVKTLRQELAVVRAERDMLKTQAAVAQANFDWCRLRVNTLEYEKSALMAKAFNVHIPAPEIVRTQRDMKTLEPSDIFAGAPLSAYDNPDDDLEPHYGD
jgi:hypothetical protein